MYNRTWPLPRGRRWEAMAGKLTIPKGFKLIFRAWITGKDGTRVYAKDKGLRGLPLLVPINK